MPWSIRAYAVFLLGLASFEIVVVVWSRPALLDLPALRYTLEMGYAYSLPLVYFAIKYRRRELRRAIVAVLAIQTLYAGSVFALRADGVATKYVVWTIVSSLFWIAVLSSRDVRGFFSASRQETVSSSDAAGGGGRG